MRGVRNSGFSLRVNQEYTVRRTGCWIVVVEEFLDLVNSHQEERNLENSFCI